jgi:AraC-like DNA-binding protein
MTLVWSTTQIHPRDRRAWWVDEMCAHCQVDCEPAQDARLFGQGTIADIGGVLQIGKGATSAQVITRSSRQIARGDDRLFITLGASGRSLVSQHGREALLADGDFALTDRTHHYQIACDADVAQTVLMLPRDLLSQRIGPVERFTSARIDGRQGFGGLLSPMLQNLPDQLAAIAEDVQPRIAENVLDLIATALLSLDGETPRSAHMTCVRAKFWIETHLTEELSAERIAAACGVSVRHLNRLFMREEASLMQHVWHRRLDRCRRALSDDRMAHRTIGEIAFAAGFRDLSHFSHAYRARFGCSPRDQRHGRSPSG